MFGDVRKISVAKLRVGYVCAADVLDEHQRVLIAAGTRLTPQFIQRLRERKVQFLTIGAQDYEHLTISSNDPAARGAVPPRDSAAHTLTDSRRVDRRREPLCPARGQRFRDQLNKTLHLIDDIGSSALNLTAAATRELSSVPQAIVEMLIEDTDQAILSTQAESLQNLSARMAHMSVLASGLALEMGHSKAEVDLVGQAAILHDIGLFVLPEEIRDHSQPLDEEQQRIFRSHPRLAVEMLADCPGISEGVKLLVMQVHELGDGSGYPRGLLRHRQHPLTRILCLVEVYLALTAPGPDRLPLIPHDALRVMLYQCRGGSLDSDVMRAFINQHTLFPLGSRVELDDATEAVSARRDGEAYDQPIVTRVDSTGEQLINLSDASRRVVRPLCDVHRQMRLLATAAQHTELSSLIYA